MSNRGETGAFLNNSPGNNSNSGFLAGNRKIIILVLIALLVVAAVIGTIVAVTLPKDDTGLSSEAGPGENSTSTAQTTGLASVAPPEEESDKSPTESSNTNVQTHVNCPDSERFFKTSNFQCFRYFSDVGNWNSAKKRCASEGMALAKPSDDVAVELSQDLKDALCPSHICSHAVWIGGRGSGSSFKWDRDGSELSNESPLWANQQPYSKKKDRCLGIWQGDEQPYKGPPCKMSQWTLCEVIS